MSISERVTTMIERIGALISASNETTGENDTTLSDAVNSLIEGFGKIPGVSILTGTVELSQKTGIIEIDHNMNKIPRFIFVYTDTAYSSMSTGCALIAGTAFYGTAEQKDTDGGELTGENEKYNTVAQCSTSFAYVRAKAGPTLYSQTNEVYDGDTEHSLPSGAYYDRLTNEETAFFPYIVGKSYGPVKYRWVIIG